MSKAGLSVLIPIAVLLLTVLSPAQESSPSESPLRGMVKSPGGKPLEGVAVSARIDGKTVTTTVYTDLDGRYHFPPLNPPMAAGQYRVWAQAVGFDAGRSAATLSADNSAEQNFTLQPLQDFSRQLSGVEWMASLPADTPQDRRMQRIIGIECIQCHVVGLALQNRFDADGWTVILNFMEKSNDHAGLYANEKVNPFMHGSKEEIVEYLTRARGPDSNLDYQLLPRVTGEAAQIVVTEYDISPGHLPGYSTVQNGSDWSLGTPSRHESGATHGVIWAPNGYVWFADNFTPERSLGKLDPSTGEVTSYTWRDKNGVPGKAHDIFADSKGNIWFNNRPSDTLDKFDPRTEKFHHYPRPDSVPPGVGRLIDEDSKGNIWEGIQGGTVLKVDPEWGIPYLDPDPQQPGGAMKLNPDTGEYTFYPALTPGITVYGVAIDAEDNVWFTRTGSDLLGIVDARTGKVDELNLSAPEQDDVIHTALDKELASKFEPIDQYGPPWQKGPRRLIADRKLQTQWIALSKSNSLARINIHTWEVTEYPLPYPFSFPYTVAVDKNHMVWISCINTDNVFKFNPFTEQFTAYPLPTRGTDGRMVSVDNTTDPPTVWIPYFQTSKVARIQFRTPTGR